MKTQSKNLSIMLTDVRGFSTLSSHSSRDQISDFVAKYRDLINPVVSFYRGKIIKNLGDSFLITFDSATDAVVAAIAIMMIVNDYNRLQKERDASRQVNLRIVINTGDVSISQGDIFGDAVNTTARMEKLPCFEQGGIGISESTYLLMNRSEIHAEDLGKHEIKGSEWALRVFRVPLEQQKLHKIPAKLINLADSVDKGKLRRVKIELALYSLLRRRRVATAVAAAFFFAGLFLFMNAPRRSPGSPNETQRFLAVLMASDPSGSGRIEKKSFKGTEKEFAELDRDGNGVVTVDEIMAYASEHGIVLPPPPGGFSKPGLPRDPTPHP